MRRSGVASGGDRVELHTAVSRRGTAAVRQTINQTDAAGGGLGVVKALIEAVDERKLYFN